MRRALALGLWLLAASASADEPAEKAPAVNAATRDALVAAIRPSPGECAWSEVGWRPSFAAAVVEARAAAKPILLWAMNGHPLACT